LAVKSIIYELCYFGGLFFINILATNCHSLTIFVARAGLFAGLTGKKSFTIPFGYDIVVLLYNFTAIKGKHGYMSLSGIAKK